MYTHMSAGICEPVRRAVVSLSYMMVGAMIAGQVRARRGTATHCSPVSPACSELIGTVRRTQIPVPHVAEELEQLVRRGISALGTDGLLAPVLEFRSPLGAQIYAFSRASPVGMRLWGDAAADPASDGEVSRPRHGVHERLNSRELEVWNRLAAASGGWCAYATLEGEDSLHTQYVYVERARTPKVPDMFVTAGFSI